MTAELVAISDFYFGKNYFRNHIFPLYKNQENASIKVATIDEQTIVGFTLSFTITLSNLPKIIEITLPKNVHFSDSVGVLNTIVIKEGFQNRQIGKKLVANILDDFLSQNIKDCLVIGWKNNETIFIDKLCQSFGFQIIGFQKNYWREDVLNQKYNCSKCGNDCYCCMVLYYKSLIFNSF